MAPSLRVNRPGNAKTACPGGSVSVTIDPRIGLPRSASSVRGRLGVLGNLRVGLAARLIALDREMRQIVRSYVSGDVLAIETRGLEVDDARIAVAHRILQRVEVLIDEEIGAD